MHVDGYFIDPKNNDAFKSWDFKQLRKDKKKKAKVDWFGIPTQLSLLFLQEEHLDLDTFSMGLD